MASSAAIESACQALNAAASAFDEHLHNQVAPQDKTLLKAAAQTLRAEAGKVGVLCTVTTDANQLDPLLASFQQTAATFCECCHRFTAGAGPTLRDVLKQKVALVVASCLALVKALGEPDEGNIRHLVGVVWNSCDDAQSSPVDNKTAIFRQLVEVANILKDIAREMEELLRDGGDDSTSNGYHSFISSGKAENGSVRAQGQAQQLSETSHASHGGSDGGAGGNEDRNDDDDDDDGDADDDSDGRDTEEEDEYVLNFTVDKLQHHEQQAVESSLQLLQLSLAITKELSRQLLQGAQAALEGAPLECWESVLFHCRNLKTAAEELGAACYPPQTCEDVSENASALLISLELLDAEAPWVEPRSTALEELFQKLPELQQKLVSNENDG